MTDIVTCNRPCLGPSFVTVTATGRNQLIKLIKAKPKPDIAEFDSVVLCDVNHWLSFIQKMFR